MDNGDICLFQTSTGLIKGNVAITGFANAARISGVTVIVKNKARPTRSGNRALGNPQLPPMVIITPLGSAVCNTFQVLVDGANVGTVTITYLISDGKNAQKSIVITLTNAYVIEWDAQGDRDGGDCRFVLVYDSLNENDSPVNQAQKAAGKTAAKVKKTAQATK